MITDVEDGFETGTADGRARVPRAVIVAAKGAQVRAAVGGRHLRQSITKSQAQDAALRELTEETGLRPGHGLAALWQLETVNTYFLATQDHVMLSPCFAAEALHDAELRLDETHDAHRWVQRDMVDRLFLWPGQRAAVDHIVRDIVSTDSPMAQHLRLDIGNA